MQQYVLCIGRRILFRYISTATVIGLMLCFLPGCRNGDADEIELRSRVNDLMKNFASNHSSVKDWTITDIRIKSF